MLGQGFVRSLSSDEPDGTNERVSIVCIGFFVGRLGKQGEEISERGCMLDAAQRVDDQIRAECRAANPNVED